MAETLTGWGVKDPEGRLLPFLPKGSRALALDAASSYLDTWRSPGAPGCRGGQKAAADVRYLRRSWASFTTRLRALGYRVVKVELREVTEC